MRKYKIGIIGYGDFTKLLLEYLAPYAEVVVSSRSRTEGDAGFGARFAPVAEVLAQPIIIPSIPAQFIESFFTQNKKIVNPSALVIDVCSVKVQPLEVLTEVLPSSCSIIGTHPLFGPASVAKNKGIAGLRCVVCDVRSKKSQYKDLIVLLSEKLKLHVLERTPDQHDQEMAYVMGLSHYIGRVMDTLDIPKSELSTLAYDDLLDMKHVQGKDTWDLFESIVAKNPYTPEILTKFKKAQAELDERIEQHGLLD